MVGDASRCSGCLDWLVYHFLLLILFLIEFEKITMRAWRFRDFLCDLLFNRLQSDIVVIWSIFEFASFSRIQVDRVVPYKVNLKDNLDNPSMRIFPALLSMTTGLDIKLRFTWINLIFLHIQQIKRGSSLKIRRERCPSLSPQWNDRVKKLWTSLDEFRVRVYFSRASRRAGLDKSICDKLMLEAV